MDFSITGNAGNQKILSSVLIQFAENLFKYGKLNDPENKAMLKISINEKSLTLITSNFIESGESYYATGTGFKNLKKRLEYAYEDKFTLNKEEKK